MKSILVANPECWNRRPIETHVAAVTKHEEKAKKEGCSVNPGCIACTGCNIEINGTRYCTAAQEPTEVTPQPDAPYPDIPDLTRIPGFRQVHQPEQPSESERFVTLPDGWLTDML